VGANVNESGWETVKRLLLALLALVVLYKLAEDGHAWLTKKQCARFGCWSTSTRHTTAVDVGAAAKVAGKASDLHCKAHAAGPLDYLQGAVGYVTLPLAFGLFVLLPLWGAAKLIGVMRMGLGR
jgi:hypothetical protein